MATLPQHACCYYWHQRGCFFAVPMIKSSAETSIETTSSRTVLRQTFQNLDRDNIEECSYQFPLYDGVSVVGFRITVGTTKVLEGVVKENEEAQEMYISEVKQGRTAGLLQQSHAASDVFKTSIGNVPVGASIEVEITYIAELKHDTESDSLRFEMPTGIAPRYGGSGAAFPYNGSQTWFNCQQNELPVEGDFKWVAKIRLTSPISSVSSPSHPVSVHLGILNKNDGEEPNLKRCRAELSLSGQSGLSTELVLLVNSKGIKNPVALLEKHESIPNQYAVMATLVPNFALEPIRPEIVFVCDRSGSMGGFGKQCPIALAANAMNILLHSLPRGVKFNICSFGSEHSFLWPKSEPYGRSSLETAVRHVDAFKADFGGTETYGALKAVIDNRYGDIPLEIILLTDGDIWRQGDLFQYLNKEVSESRGQIRVFPLGIGRGVSTALIEGVARAGNGFAQMVMEGERMDQRCVRMLKAAVSPHVTNYKLQMDFEEASADESDFEFVDGNEGQQLPIRAEGQRAEVRDQPKAPVSLFDPEVDPDALRESKDSLPDVSVPEVILAPHELPPLYPFSRTTAYILISPEAAKGSLKSVTLKATYDGAELKLQIPVHDIGSGKTVHQLAARKASQDLEEARGWLYDTGSGSSLEKKYPSRFGDLVKREAVRLGETFQIINKWCSFVAVNESGAEARCETTKLNSGGTVLSATICSASGFSSSAGTRGRGGKRISPGITEAAQSWRAESSRRTEMKHPRAAGGLFGAHQSLSMHSVHEPSIEGFGSVRQSQASAPTGTFGNSGMSVHMDDLRRLGSTLGSRAPTIGGTFGGSGMSTHAGFGRSFGTLQQPQASPPAGMFGNSDLRSARQNYGLFGASGMQFSYQAPTYLSATDVKRKAIRDEESAMFNRSASEEMDVDEESLSGYDGGPQKFNIGATLSDSSPAALFGNSFGSSTERLHEIISLQDFDGFWSRTQVSRLGDLLGISQSSFVPGDSTNHDVWVTMLVLKFLEKRMGDEYETWELISGKARDWIRDQITNVEEEALFRKANDLILD